MSILLKVFLTLVLGLVLARYVVPYFVPQFQRVRVFSLSFRSIRGFEYRSHLHPQAVVPILRIERLGWRWNAWREEGGFFVVQISGVSLRVKKDLLDKQENTGGPKPAGRIAAWKSRSITSALHLCIHHYPSLAQVISFQVNDFRLIFDDLDGLELTIRELHSGVQINFEGDSSPSDFMPPSVQPSPMSPQGEFRRDNPLASPVDEFSPPGSPLRQFSSFTFPNGQACPEICPPRASRIANARRRASVFHTRMSSTATQVWSRAIGRAHGSVSVHAVIRDVAIILPHFQPARPLSARSSTFDLAPKPHPQVAGLSHRSSSKSTNTPRDEWIRSFSSVGSFHSLLHPTPPRYARPAAEGGFERLLTIDGESKVTFDLGFGPKKGLLGEDTLKTDLELGNLQTSLGALDKVKELYEAHPLPKRDNSKKQNQWAPRSMPRIIMRAFESVALSVQQVSLFHYLPTSTSQPVSASSSTTDMSELGKESDMFTVSANLTSVTCRLETADSSNNQRARNAFGTNPSPESKVRGIGYQLGWSTISLQCLAPGEREEETSQLFQMRSADFEGLSTWRPAGWSREELLFASDPNLALVVGRGTVDSIDVAADVQLLDELNQAIKRDQPARMSKPKEAKTSQPFSLPPRFRVVLDVGHAMILLADRVSESKTTLTLASDGLHFGCFSQFSDVIGRRRDRTSNKAAFKQEEELRQRRDEAGDDADYTLPPSMLKPQLRRHFAQTPARLSDDFAISMHTEATLALEPMSLHMTLSGKEERDQQTYHLASIGRAHGQFSGDILGRHETRQDGADVATLDPQSVSCSVDLGIDSGVKLNLWNMPVIEALITMAQVHSPSPAETTPSKPGSLLCRLPSGISARLSFGLVSVFIGHEDPNPHCPLKLTRGLWIQSTTILEYAYYNKRAQAMQSRHAFSAPTRTKLRLPEDITTQALAFYNALSDNDGRAALISFTLVDTFVKPIFNGERFVKAGGTNLSHENPKRPKARTGDTYVGWDFRRQQQKGTGHEKGNFANNIPPLELSDTDQASRPMLRIPQFTVNWLVKRSGLDSEVQHKITSRINWVDIVCDLSHMYCSILAVQAIRRIVLAAKRAEPAGKTKKVRDISLEIIIPSVRAHLAFPLCEHAYIYLDTATVSKSAAGGIGGGATKFLIFVPSVRETGSWEELVRIKKLDIASKPSGTSKAIAVGAEALRVRIPTAYQLSKLILNINVAIKALKLLVKDLSGKDFSTVHKPGPQGPKQVSSLSFSVNHVSLEAKDDPIETNLNLIWRAGMAEQELRNKLEDTFEEKIKAIEEHQQRMYFAQDDDPAAAHSHGKLTGDATTTLEDARARLDWWKSKSWIKRIRLAKQEQRRREQTALRHVQDAGLNNVRLPIAIVESSLTAPLFRLALDGFKLSVSDLGWSRSEIIDYMGAVSAPFSPDAEFSLMVPLQLSWTMKAGVATLRDYPLPLVRIQPISNPSPSSDAPPAWKVETPFIIAEEISDDDSIILVPCDVLPEGCGSKDAKAFTVQIAKTIMPVKTYSRPIVDVSSDKTTEFCWGNSYQPAIQDFMKVIESMSHPPRDTSPRVGFWDKFRLILHWKVTLNFKANVHLHLKGSYDPYNVLGHGAGFALAWKGGTTFEINQSNEQGEVIQISARELLIAIPDLTALHDSAALGTDGGPKIAKPPNDHTSAEQSLVSRRYTKPCARFQNGVRVGFGFTLERTCRRWNCTHGCGETEKLLRRQCRDFTFKPHQEVILRSPEVLERMEEEAGHPIDSYEGFRSDFIHFSVSVTAPLDGCDTQKEGAETQNSLHFSPKAFAHFFAWWRLFNHVMSLPIRQGKLFPLSPPPSKKFGRSLGTIKYRFDLAPVYVSHVYQQGSKELWDVGRTESLGVKFRFDAFKADAHQRAQEQIVRHEKLHRTNVVVHKPFYAADFLLSGIQAKGLRADFVEIPSRGEGENLDGVPQHKKASELEEGPRSWYNFFDFIDADSKPFDLDPGIEIVDLMDCPQLFVSKRVKARQTTAHDDDESSLRSSDDGGVDMESSKFGHEETHICYLGVAPGVATTQISITRKRIMELETHGRDMQHDPKFDFKLMQTRLKTLHRHLDELRQGEKRHMDAGTLEQNDGKAEDPQQSELAFEETFHVHCPTIFWNNASRNIVYRYWFSSRARKREEYTTSHASLRGVRESIQRRMNRQPTGDNQDDLPDHMPLRDEAAQEVLQGLQNALGGSGAASLFRLPSDHGDDHDDLRTPSLGLPDDCAVKPKRRILVLKPQIALRSKVDDDAIVLLAVEEVSYKGFSIIDEVASDSVTADVLTRNYVAMKGIQAFYPSENALTRQTQPKMGHGLDFVPLEIFVDVKSEATDYDRIVLKTDASMSIDKFNQLRMPRGLEWPQTQDEHGKPIDHLRLHQDLTTITVPRLTVSATSKHYNALYTVVTDLLLYQDPDHRSRAERIDNFTYAFDRKDKDPQRLLMDLFHLQHTIRELKPLRQGYEANIDRLTDEGRDQLFRIRNDDREGKEQLGTVFEAISVNQARDDARNALKSASRMDVRVGGIAWHMLQDNLKPLVKLDIEGTLYSWVSNKDGSNDSAIAFSDIATLNSDADALYPEVLTRYETGGLRQVATGKRNKDKESFAAACWSIMSPVGGIVIVRDLGFYVHPVRFNLEEIVGHGIGDYIFSERVARRKAHGTSTKNYKQQESLGLGHPEGHKSQASIKSRSTSGLPHLHRTRSATSVASMSTTGKSTGDADGNGQMESGDGKFQLVPTKDAAEMKARAGKSKTFVKIVFASTSFVLSFKSDERKKHRGFSIPDCVDFKIKTPDMVYYNKTWGYEDIFEHVKRDLRSYIWSQTGPLLGQIVSKTSIFRSKKGLKNLATRATSELRKPHDSAGHSPSRLRFAVEPPTPQDEDGPSNLGRSASREPSPLVKSVSRSDRSLDSPVMAESPTAANGSGASGNDSEDEHEHEGRVGGKVKGFFAKVKKHTSSFDLYAPTSDDLARYTSPDRSDRGKRVTPVTSPTLGGNRRTSLSRSSTHDNPILFLGA